MLLPWQLEFILLLITTFCLLSLTVLKALFGSTPEAIYVRLPETEERPIPSSLD